MHARVPLLTPAPPPNATRCTVQRPRVDRRRPPINSRLGWVDARHSPHTTGGVRQLEVADGQGEVRGDGGVTTRRAATRQGSLPPRGCLSQRGGLADQCTRGICRLKPTVGDGRGGAWEGDSAIPTRGDPTGRKERHACSSTYLWGVLMNGGTGRDRRCSWRADVKTRPQEASERDGRLHLLPREAAGDSLIARAMSAPARGVIWSDAIASNQRPQEVTEDNIIGGVGDAGEKMRGDWTQWVASTYARVAGTTMALT